MHKIWKKCQIYIFSGIFTSSLIYSYCNKNNLLKKLKVVIKVFYVLENYEIIQFINAIVSKFFTIVYLFYKYFFFSKIEIAIQKFHRNVFIYMKNTYL